MSDPIGSNGNTPVTPVTDQPRLDVSPLGKKDGLSVSSVPPESNLNELNPAGPDDTGLDQRTVAQLDNVTPTPGLAAPEEIDNKTFEERQEIEDKTLAEAGDILKKTEEFKVLDLALKATSGEPVDPRHKLKITLQMPGEQPPPLQLIPMGKNVSERADLKELMSLAQSLLKDHLTDSFAGFDYRGSQEKLNTLKETLDGNAKKMESKDPDFCSEWKEKYGELERRQAFINVGDTHNRIEDIFGTDKSDNEKLTGSADSVPGPVLTVQGTDSEEDTGSLWDELTTLEPDDLKESQTVSQERVQEEEERLLWDELTTLDPDDLKEPQTVSQELVKEEEVPEEPAEDVTNPVTSQAFKAKFKAELSDILRDIRPPVGENKPASTDDTTKKGVHFSDESEEIEGGSVEDDYPSVSQEDRAKFTADLKKSLKSKLSPVGKDGSDISDNGRTDDAEPVKNTTGQRVRFADELPKVPERKGRKR